MTYNFCSILFMSLKTPYNHTMTCQIPPNDIILLSIIDITNNTVKPGRYSGIDPSMMNNIHYSAQ